ncbi:MAG: hypothetical protein Q7R87_00065 [Nanoarchaeota archaeon]|nr:hypothetical protein [Nanoarchaeota archaeon]
MADERESKQPIFWEHFVLGCAPSNLLEKVDYRRERKFVDVLKADLHGKGYKIMLSATNTEGAPDALLLQGHTARNADSDIVKLASSFGYTYRYEGHFSEVELK